MAPRVEGPNMAPMMKPNTMLMMARITTPAQYLARLMRPSNDVKRYWKSIRVPSLCSRVSPGPSLVRPKGRVAKGGCEEWGFGIGRSLSAPEEKSPYRLGAYGCKSSIAPARSIPEQLVDRGLGAGFLVDRLDDHGAIERGPGRAV